MKKYVYGHGKKNMFYDLLTFTEFQIRQQSENFKVNDYNPMISDFLQRETTFKTPV